MRSPLPPTGPVSDQLTVEVERGGRRFPLDDPTTPPRATGRVRLRQLREDRSDVALAAQIAQALWRSLSWSALPAAATDRQLLVQTYITGLNQLGDRRREVQSLLRAACEANLEFRQGQGETHTASRDAALAQQLDQMLADAAANWRAAPNILDAALVSQSLPPLRSRLDSSLSEAAQQFTQEFLTLMARLVDRGQVGLVEWLPNNCCSYHFFRRVVIQQRWGTTTRVTREITTEDPRTAARSAVVGSRSVEGVTRGQHEFRLARHEHEVMNAVRTTIANSRVVQPPPVGRLLERVPRWLYPSVEIIDGQIFRERIIERDTGTADWTDVQIRDEPIFGSDPGVIIGPYVLVGWGPREIAEEERRRARELAQAESVLAVDSQPTPVWRTLTQALFANS